MTSNSLDRLPRESRLWIFPSELRLSTSQRRRIDERLASYMGGWRSHGTPVDAAHQILHDRFVLVSAYSADGVSGCSIDALMREVRDLGSEIESNLMPGDLVFFRAADGEIRSVRFMAFADLLSRGEVSSETPVFDTTLEKLGLLREERFEVPLRECWHARTFGLPTS